MENARRYKQLFEDAVFDMLPDYKEREVMWCFVKAYNLGTHPLVWSSATEVLNHLGWDNFTKRRFHRLILFFKAVNGLIDWNFKFHSYKDTHNNYYNTRRRNNICKPQSRFSWSQNRFIYQAADDWKRKERKIKKETQRGFW